MTRILTLTLLIGGCSSPGYPPGVVARTSPGCVENVRVNYITDITVAVAFHEFTARGYPPRESPVKIKVCLGVRSDWCSKDACSDQERIWVKRKKGWERLLVYEVVKVMIRTGINTYEPGNVSFYRIRGIEDQVWGTLYRILGETR